MKNIFYIALTSLALFSCNKDIKKLEPDSPTNTDPVLSEKIYLSEKIKNMIPTEYRTLRYAIFKNASNEYKYMYINYKQDEEIRRIGDTFYKSEYISVTLSETEKPDFYSYYISVGANGSYAEDTKLPIWWMTIQIHSFKHSGILPMIDIDDSGKTRIGKLLETHQLLDKAFSNVYVNYLMKPQDQFSEIFYNFKEGVIGFYDRENHLWVLDRYE